jgi:hypothetical protein
MDAVTAILPRSVAGRKQLIEQVAEPGLKHLDLGLGQRRVSATLKFTTPTGSLRAPRPCRHDV